MVQVPRLQRPALGAQRLRMPSSPEPSGRAQYNRSEIQAILGRALDNQANGGDGYTHAQLLETARELGLTPAEVQAAIAAEQEAAERQALTATVLASRRRGLRSHAVAYGAVNAMLWVVDALTVGMGSNPQPGWHWLVAALWAVGLTVHAFKVLFADPQEIAAQVEALRQQRLRRLRSEEMQRAIEGAVTEVVSTGAEALSRVLRGGGKGR